MGIREIDVIVADKISGFVQVDGLRVLCCMVDSSIEGNHRIFSRLQGECPACAAELPDALGDRGEVGEDGCSGFRVLLHPYVGRLCIVRVECPETKAVEVLHFRVVIVKDEVFVGLVISFQRQFGTTAAVDFLDNDSSCPGVEQRKVESHIPVGQFYIVGESVEDVLFTLVTDLHTVYSLCQ